MSKRNWIIFFIAIFPGTAGGGVQHQSPTGRIDPRAQPGAGADPDAGPGHRRWSFTGGAIQLEKAALRRAQQYLKETAPPATGSMVKGGVA